MSERDTIYKGKRYLALVRASDDADGTTSTEAQLSLLHSHATGLGMICADAVVMSGMTGSMPGKRNDLQAILKRKTEKNDFDVLILQRLDRLTRSGSAHGFWFEHECKCAGIHLMFVGDDIPEGQYSSLIKVAKYEAAREQAFSISQRSTQGYQFALEQGRVITSSHTPFGCWRLYLTAEDKPSHIIRDLRDGRQQKLDPRTHAVIDTYGQVGGGSKGHYRKQKHEKVSLMPGDRDQVAIVRDIFDMHYRHGFGGKRIADQLNRRGLSSPQGRAWSQRQVEVIYQQEAYTGRSIGNRTSSAIYHQRQASAPRRVDLDPAILATAKTIPIQLRPPEQWFTQDQPLMKDFLADEQLRLLAIEGQERFWRHMADPARAKRSKSKHKASEYLLTGLLFAKQDGEPLVGVLCGRVGKKVRYYRHRRGRRGYIKRSTFNRMIHAVTIEQAVLGTVKDNLLNKADLRDRIIALADQSTKSFDQNRLEDLHKQRDQLRRRTELIVGTLDDETLADARSEIDRLKTRRRELDQQIAAMESAPTLGTVDAGAVADAVIERLARMASEVETVPIALLRQWLGTMVEKVAVDMETKDIEIRLALPADLLSKSAISAQEPMRLVSTSASSTSDETHQTIGLVIDIIDCNWIKSSNQICYRCRRRSAA